MVSPKHPPNLEYITATGAACTKLSQQDAEELRADINRVLRSSHPKPNLTKAQNLILRELRRDRDHIVLTADKGVVMVIMDRQDYINKANSLLNQNTYRSIPRDPTNTIKNSCGTVTYGVAKELAKILKPLVGKSPHHIYRTQDFVEQVKHITLTPGECLSSYDVPALFTSVPVDPALNIIKDLLEKDHTLKERTALAVSYIILLLEFCLKNTYFSFQDQSYEQVEGAAMSFQVSSIVANLYMEYLEQKALSTAPHPQVLGQVCGWYLCHPQGSQQTRLPSTHQQC